MIVALTMFQFDLNNVVFTSLGANCKTVWIFFKNAHIGMSFVSVPRYPIVSYYYFARSFHFLSNGSKRLYCKELKKYKLRKFFSIVICDCNFIFPKMSLPTSSLHWGLWEHLVLTSTLELLFSKIRNCIN